ncbi:MAG: ribosome-associated heat shock protein Hsp15 [Janthinobacterium sp.]|jgi:ribosome-associated heat shock protein Hsp15
MSVRLDKWLWAARFFKTRTQAGAAIENGKVRVGAERIKPAHPVRLLDALNIDNGSDVWDVIVRGVSEVRAAAPVARTLYAETAESIVRRDNLAHQKKWFPEPSAGLKGRPSKRDRRQLSKASTDT